MQWFYINTVMLVLYKHHNVGKNLGKKKFLANKGVFLHKIYEYEITDSFIGGN